MPYRKKVLKEIWTSVPRIKRPKFRFFTPKSEIMRYSNNTHTICKSRKGRKKPAKLLSKRRANLVKSYLPDSWTAHIHRCLSCILKYRCEAYSFKFLDWWKKRGYGLCGFCSGYQCDSHYMFVLYQIQELLPKDYKARCCKCQPEEFRYKTKKRRGISGIHGDPLVWIHRGSYVDVDRHPRVDRDRENWSREYEQNPHPG